MVDLSIGPKEGVEYPVDTQYCGNCTMPIEVSVPEYLGHIRKPQ